VGPVIRFDVDRVSLNRSQAQNRTGGTTEQPSPPLEKKTVAPVTDRRKTTPDFWFAPAGWPTSS